MVETLKAFPVRSRELTLTTCIQHIAFVWQSYLDRVVKNYIFLSMNNEYCETFHLSQIDMWVICNPKHTMMGAFRKYYRMVLKLTHRNKQAIIRNLLEKQKAMRETWYQMVKYAIKASSKDSVRLCQIRQVMSRTEHRALK